MIEAIITGLVAIVVCMINNVYQRRESQLKHEETINLIVYRLDQLEAKQNKHNNLIERTYELEKAERLFREKMDVANHRISDLEEFHK